MVGAVTRENVQSLQELNAPARITAPAHRSIPLAILRNNCRPYHRTGENPRIVTIRHNWPPTIKRPGFCPIVTIVHNSELLRIIKNCYEMLRIVTKCQLLRIVTKCYELLQNVKNCINSTFVLQYACTIDNDSHSQ
jgi:hypothetical protein